MSDSQNPSTDLGEEKKAGATRKGKKAEPKPLTSEPKNVDASPAPSAMVDSLGIVAGVTPLSKILGVDKNTISAWIEKGLPFVKRSEKRGEPWLFMLGPVVQWAMDYSVKKALENAGSDEDGDPELAHWELRKVKAAAETAELRLGEARGIYIRMDDAVREREEADSQVRKALNDVPGRYAEQLAESESPEECATILQEAMDEALARLVVTFTDGPEEETEAVEEAEDDEVDE